MPDDEFEPRVMGDALPRRPAERHNTDTPARMPDLVRAVRSERDSFRRSEAYLAGQIARALARGQRTQ
jgi:hypothetical protein